jgi:hypothetical protein
MYRAVHYSCLIFALASLLAVADASLPPPAAMRAVQVEALPPDLEPEEREARIGQKSQELSDAGFGPVWSRKDVRGDGREWDVILVGKLERLPDTILLKADLRRAGFEGAFERAFPNTEGIEFQSEVTTPRARLFPPVRGLGGEALRTLIDAEQSPSDNAQRRKRLLNELGGYSLHQRAGAIANRLESVASGDPIVSTLRAEQSRTMLNSLWEREVGRTNVALTLERFPQLAEIVNMATDPRYAESPAFEEDLIELRFMAADIVHECEGNFLRAYQMYSEILADHGDDPGVEARCRVEIAACLLELARSEAAFFNEVTRYCRQSLELIDGEYAHARGTLALLDAETHYFQEDYPSAIAAFTEALDSKLVATPREAALAHWMRALSHLKVQAREAASNDLLELLALGYTYESAIYWRGQDQAIQRQAASLLRSIAENEEESELAIVAKELHEQLLHASISDETNVNPILSHNAFSKRREAE